MNRVHSTSITIVLLLLSFGIKGQNTSPHYVAVRTEAGPNIDGIIDDSEWKQAEIFEGSFFQLEPDNGAPGKFKTQFRIIYTDYAIYVAGQMYDDNPELIPRELTLRDDTDRNTDSFGIILDPYNQGQNAFAFVVTSAGVQADVLFGRRSEDENWDAVWTSAISFNNQGWAAEIEIPYSAIRFPKTEIQTWGLNMYRKSQRFQEEATWSFVDAAKNGFINQSGQMTGISGIKPPLRLSFTPYVSAITTRDNEINETSTKFAGGMDLKYGISESFTLDMSLIPDFSQVRSDDQVLNLSPFEVRFNENRPFFTEGTQMFNTGRIFYSRRVGQSKGYGFKEEELSTNEDIISAPSATNLINATKVSGRTKAGTGIGFFNAITNKTLALVEDSETGEKREVLYDPLTNYNVLVIDQNLKNNSNIGLINTNVKRFDNSRNANVTLTQFTIRDKTNTWSLFGNAGYNRINFNNGDSISDGFKYSLYFSKLSGNFQFTAARRVDSDTWEVNDLGFLRSGNQINNEINLRYNIYKPFGIFNRFGSRLSIEYEELYKPRKFTEFSIEGSTNVQFKNFWRASINGEANPGNAFDYWEPRAENRYFKMDNTWRVSGSIGTDSRKPLSGHLYKGIFRRPSDNLKSDWLGFGPEYRVNNKLTVSGNLSYQTTKNGKGWVDTSDDEQIIFFGNRDLKTIEAELGLNYTFSNKMGLTFRLRNYWSQVDYSEYFELQQDGTLLSTNAFIDTDVDGVSTVNQNFDSFNIDFVYSWQIAPGSFVNIVYKNATDYWSRDVGKNYFENIQELGNSSGTHTITAKVIYYLDYGLLSRK